MIDLLAAGLTCFLLIAGAVLSLIAALGIFRMPDLYTRMQAAAKTATLGVGCTIFALAIHFGDASVTMHAVLVIVFLFLTSPVAAHMIARAGYISGIELWQGSVVDEMRSRYHPMTRRLASEDSPQHEVAADEIGASEIGASEAAADPFTPKASHNKAQGREAHPGIGVDRKGFYRDVVDWWGRWIGG